MSSQGIQPRALTILIATSFFKTQVRCFPATQFQMYDYSPERGLYLADSLPLVVIRQQLESYQRDHKRIL